MITELEKIQEDDISSEVRFDNPQSQFAPDGMVDSITGNKAINSDTTKYLSMQNYRMGKFMREFSKTGFEGLQEVTQSNGNTLWVADMEIDNQDFSFYLDQSEILSTITLTAVNNELEIADMAAKYNINPESTYIEIDGVKYFITMNYPMHFATGANNDSWINIAAFILGDGILSSAIALAIASLGIDAFKDAIKNLGSSLMKTIWALVKGATQACYRFVAKIIGRLLAGDTVEAALLAAKTAAGEAWGSAVENVTSKSLKYSVAGLIIIVGVMLFIEFVLHQSYQNVYFYNLTDYDIKLDFPYKDHGNYYNLPTSDVLAKTQRFGPGGIDLGSWYNGVAFRYQSDSEFHGLGYTMKFQFIDPKTQTVTKTFSCLFDVPYAGENSLFASTSQPTSYSSYYSSNSGEHKTTQYSANDGTHEILVTYDYLDGEHEDPETGNNLYYYQSLVVIRDIASATY